MNDNPIHMAVKAGKSLSGLATVIDTHGHGGPWYNFWAPANDPDSMVRILDRLGVEALVFCPHLGIGADPAIGNDIAIEWSRKYPGRLLGYAAFHPHEPESGRDELNRALDQGLVAIKLHPSVHQCSVQAPAYRIAWEVAKERNTFILSHTWYNCPYCAPKMFAQSAADYPQVPVILGHSGGTPAGFPEAIELARTYSNLYLDTCGSYVTGEWVVRMVQAVGADRVVYGSDLPFIDARYGLGKVALSGLDLDQLRMVLGLNAKRLLAAASVYIG
ncbi:MAG: amidohydrolase family protein [Anaerolineae bacterium]